MPTKTKPKRPFPRLILRAQLDERECATVLGDHLGLRTLAKRNVVAAALRASLTDCRHLCQAKLADPMPAHVLAELIPIKVHAEQLVGKLAKLGKEATLDEPVPTLTWAAEWLMMSPGAIDPSTGKAVNSEREGFLNLAHLREQLCWLVDNIDKQDGRFLSPNGLSDGSAHHLRLAELRAAMRAAAERFFDEHASPARKKGRHREDFVEWFAECAMT